MPRGNVPINFSDQSRKAVVREATEIRSEKLYTRRSNCRQSIKPLLKKKNQTNHEIRNPVNLEFAKRHVDVSAHMEKSSLV